MSITSSSHLLPPGRVAEILGVCKPTIAAWVRRGLLTCEYTAGHQRRFTHEEVRRRRVELDKPIPVWLREAPVQLEAPAPSNEVRVETRTYPLPDGRGVFFFALPPGGLRRVDVERISCHLLSFVAD
jgi:hypothetical protein